MKGDGMFGGPDSGRTVRVRAWRDNDLLWEVPASRRAEAERTVARLADEVRAGSHGEGVFLVEAFWTDEADVFLGSLHHEVLQVPAPAVLPPRTARLLPFLAGPDT